MLWCYWIFELVMNVIMFVVMFEFVLVSLCFSEGLGWDGFVVILFGIWFGMYWVFVMVQYCVIVYVGVFVWVNCVCDGCCYLGIQVFGDVNVILVGLFGIWMDDVDCWILCIVIIDMFVCCIGEQVGVLVDIMFCL